MKLHVHNHIMVIYIQYKFFEIPSVCFLVMAEDRKKWLKFRQPKDNNSAITGNTQKILVHNLTMVIYIHFEFHPYVS